MPTALLQSTLPLPVRRGKVRDVYDLGDSLLIVATDRISAFDCVMPNGIPDKGRVLTALSLFWFDRFARRFENHLLALTSADYPAAVRPYAEQLEGRSMLVKKAEVVPIECVARGYLAGLGVEGIPSSRGRVCGVAAAAGPAAVRRAPRADFHAGDEGGDPGTT